MGSNITCQIGPGCKVWTDVAEMTVAGKQEIPGMDKSDFCINYIDYPTLQPPLPSYTLGTLYPATRPI